MDNPKEFNFEARKQFVLSGLAIIDEALKPGHSYEQIENLFYLGVESVMTKDKIMYACAMIFCTSESWLTKLNAQKESPVQ
jgi:hypothetical protein